MRKTHKIRYKKVPMRLERKIIYVLLYSFIIGCIIGGISAFILPTHLASTIEANINLLFSNMSLQINSQEVFTNALVKYIGLLIILWFLAFVPIGSIFTVFMIVLKGISFGLTTLFLIRIYAFHGIVYIFSLYILQNLLIIPTALFVAYRSLLFIFGDREKNKKEIMIKYGITFVICLCSALIASLLEAYAIPSIFLFFYKI